jgi:hypothetical protein
MKKKLESELKSIANRILNLSEKDEVSKLHAEVSELYEKLTILKFAQENFEDDMPTIGTDTSFFDMLDVAFNNKFSDTIEVEDKMFVNVDDVEDDGIMEHVTEKIKDMVAHMPHEEDNITDNVLDKHRQQTIFEDLAVGFDDLPVFEPLDEANAPDKSKSLNEKLKSTALNIGLNDKIAFVKHLFDSSIEDYERVLSQLNTIENYDDAFEFIQNMVKPDYDNWQGKDEFENRFMKIIESKYN